MTDTLHHSLYSVPIMRNMNTRHKVIFQSYRDRITMIQHLDIFPDEDTTT